MFVCVASLHPSAIWSSDIMDGPAATTIPDLRAVSGAIAAQFQTALHPTLRHGVSFSEFRPPKSAIPLRPTADFTGALLLLRLDRFPPFKRCRCRPPPQRESGAKL